MEPEEKRTTCGVVHSAALALDVGMAVQYWFDRGSDEWWSKARCLGLTTRDPEMYERLWSDKGPVVDCAQTVFIATYCDRCPVRDECRRYGERSRSRGVWGGQRLNGNQVAS